MRSHLARPTPEYDPRRSDIYASRLKELNVRSWLSRREI